MRLAVGAALLIAGPACANADGPRQVAGLYEIDQMEMGGGLELRPNGRFRYALEYGAVSERGEGDWVIDRNAILLTSNPMPPPPKSTSDLGTARFDRTPLTMENGNLVLWRWDARIVLKPVQPRPR